MKKWLGWTGVVVLALLGLVVLAGQEPAKVQSGVYLCSAVEQVKSQRRCSLAFTFALPLKALRCFKLKG